MSVDYIDTSAWLKRYVDEDGSGTVRRWFAKKPALATSPLAIVELLATLARKQRSGELSQARFDEIARVADEDFDNFIVVPFDSEVVALARSLPRTYALKGADTIHLASAIRLRTLFPDDEETVRVVTIDVELRQAAQMSRFPAPAIEDLA